MTSASNLFHARRIRFGASPSDSSRHRNNRHGCNRHGISEHEHVHVEQGRSQPPSGSIINSEDFRSIRRWGATENDRLPGVVLLARERLLERLRGVRVSENRQSNTSSSSSIHQDDSSYRSSLETNSNVVQDSVDTWAAVMPPLSLMTRMLPLPRGLSDDELNLLAVTVFKNVNESCSVSKECSICLEGFEDGEKLIKLSCMHRFHSCCLLPWVKVCGACPNCRKDIVVTSN